MRAPEALLLDAGNTFLFPDHEAMAAVLRELGHAVGAAVLERCQPEANRAYVARLRAGASHENGWSELMRSWVVAAGVRPEQAAGAVRALRAAHDVENLWRRVPPFVPGALERARRSGLALGVVSNSEGRLQDLLDRLGLDVYFDVVVDSGCEGVHKPDPRIFWSACERLGKAPDACLYAGDLPEIDVDGARAAGLEAALIDAFDCYGDYQEAPRFASVEALVDSIVSLGAS